MPSLKSPHAAPLGPTPSWTHAFQVGASCPLVDLRTVAYEFRVGESFIRNLLATLGVPTLVIPSGAPEPVELVHVIALERAIFKATFPMGPGEDITAIMEWVQKHYTIGRKKAILELLRSTAPAARHLKYRVTRGGWKEGVRKRRRGRAATHRGRPRKRAPLKPGSTPSLGWEPGTLKPPHGGSPLGPPSPSAPDGSGPSDPSPTPGSGTAVP